MVTVLFVEKKSDSEEIEDLTVFKRCGKKNWTLVGKKTLLRWGKNTLDFHFIWTSVGSWGKILERVSHAMPSVRYKKNRIITLLNDSTSGDVRWRPQAHISTNRWNKLRDGILIEICESGQWTEFAKTSLCIIFVALIYLESAKIYTGPEIVRGLKRLRTTGLGSRLMVKV